MTVKEATFLLLATLSWVKAVPAYAQVEIGQKVPVEMTEERLNEIKDMIVATNTQLSRIDAMIMSLDDRLITLYDQRDAVGEEPELRRRLDQVIDRMNLTLGQAEAEKMRIEKALQALETLDLGTAN